MVSSAIPASAMPWLAKTCWSYFRFWPSFLCSADSSQDCGGIWFNTVYSTGLCLGSLPPASAYQGCFEDRENRALPVVLMPSGATAASCYNAARNAGYLYAGLQWQGQCYAGNTLGYA